ncbi:MAG: putative maltokinase [Nitrospiraceae bacterium]|nr:putative maltokinase [Nitrospiraceae bacterium]
MLIVTERWERILEGEARSMLEARLPDVLKARRWFAGKARAIQSVRIAESVPVPARSSSVVLLFIRVEYVDGAPELYTLPLTAAFGEEAAQIQQDHPGTIVATLKVQTKDCEQIGVLYDALWNPDFSRTLLSAIERGSRFTGEAGVLIASPTQAYGDLIGGGASLDPAVLKAEQSNTSVAYGDRVLLKMYRRVETGINPDVEIGRVLTAMNFPHSPPLAGSIEYIRANDETVTVAILQGFVHNQGDAWKYTLEAFDQYVLRCRAQPTGREHGLAFAGPLLETAQGNIPTFARELIGPYLDSASSLGQRTAELHVALANARGNPDFTPEPFSLEYRRSRYESMCRLASQNCSILKSRLNDLPPVTKQEARRVLNDEPRMQNRFRAFFELETRALRIRCHGDYHLGQVLWTGRDFLITDFEGEPARPLSERRTKHSPIMDVAGMLRSFYYASYASLLHQQLGLHAEDAGASFEPWIRFWYGWVSVAFLKSYLRIAENVSFWPGTLLELRVLLDAHLLEKAVYEIGYELNNRPDWVRIPIRGVLDILEMHAGKVIERHRTKNER